jgi:hypothetical protein
MSVIQIMVTIIIVTILVTVILGVASYFAYWLRRSRRPAEPEEQESAPRFFYRYLPESAADDAVSQAPDAAAEPAGAAVAPGVADAEMAALAAAPTGSGNGRTRG